MANFPAVIQPTAGSIVVGQEECSDLNHKAHHLYLIEDRFADLNSDTREISTSKVCSEHPVTGG